MWNPDDRMHVPYVRWIEFKKEKIPSYRRYPFQFGWIRNLDRISLHPKVTYIVGDNGVGKSTLMEAIAVAWGFNPEGGTRNFTFSTWNSHSDLHQYIRLVKGIRKPEDGFFFRAESYYNLATNIEELDREASFGPPLKESYGGRSLHEQSHGESFFATFIHRFGGRGLYILDEPEAALSPFRQMALLTRIHELVQENSQFIISTHSPLLMAYPDSTIYVMTSDDLEIRTWEETDHTVIMKEFLNHKDKMLKQLFDK